MTFTQLLLKAISRGEEVSSMRLNVTIVILVSLLCLLMEVVAYIFGMIQDVDWLSITALVSAALYGKAVQKKTEVNQIN